MSAKMETKPPAEKQLEDVEESPTSLSGELDADTAEMRRKLRKI